MTAHLHRHPEPRNPASTMLIDLRIIYDKRQIQRKLSFQCSHSNGLFTTAYRET
jgi:hypothetical protein